MSAKTITLTIDGTTLTVPEGTTLLEAAREAGIEIPTLCHHESLADYGACRLCVVEVVRGGRSRVVASCLYPAEEGIEVLTGSEKIVRHRRVILEMLAARWPDLPQELLERYGVRTDRLAPNVNFCVMCGLCVRHCSEVKKANVLGFIGRGTSRQVVCYAELAKVHCPTCGPEMECLLICPTGVLVNDNFRPTLDVANRKSIADPVRMRDADNAKLVKKMVGER